MHQIAQLNACFKLWASQRTTKLTEHSSFAFFDHHFNKLPILLLCERLKSISNTVDDYFILVMLVMMSLTVKAIHSNSFCDISRARLI